MKQILLCCTLLFFAACGGREIFEPMNRLPINYTGSLPYDYDPRYSICITEPQISLEENMSEIYKNSIMQERFKTSLDGSTNALGLNIKNSLIKKGFNVVRVYKNLEKAKSDSSLYKTAAVLVPVAKIDINEESQKFSMQKFSKTASEISGDIDMQYYLYIPKSKKYALLKNLGKKSLGTYKLVYQKDLFEQKDATRFTKRNQESTQAYDALLDDIYSSIIDSAKIFISKQDFAWIAKGENF